MRKVFISDKNPGFTLIELLIVVGIIAILAAIAVPNFLEAQTRAKVSRVKSDLRSIAGALESYHIDYRNYPPSRSFCAGYMAPGDYYVSPPEITTPVSYITSLPLDIFNRARHYKYISPGFGFANGVPTILAIWVPRDFPQDSSASSDVIPYFDYGASPVKWALWSVGPKGDVGFWNAGMEHHPVPSRAWYDPTNGTVSDGIVVRLSTGHHSP